VETTPATGVARRRIIKRPRLTRMLDESRARIILLVAPAGYGKTTLAHEWLDERQATWYRCGPASADVAALAVGLATATSEIVPGAGDRMRQRLRATDRPEEDAKILAEMLAEDLTQWPENAWLVIDDYHFSMDSPAAEGFVHKLLEATPIRIALASRRRPSWATARRRLYGHLLELDRTTLAMKAEEALDLLSDRKDASALIDQAAGWPAVLGLAALTTAPPTRSAEVPIALYDYFAEELLNGVKPSHRMPVCQLAVIPSITTESASSLLGPQAQQPLQECIATGILQSVGVNQFELHPLLRTFLQERLRGFGADLLPATVKQVGRHLLEHQLWDDALSLAKQFGGAPFLEALIDSSWESLLAEGRLATLSSLIDLATEIRVRSPLLDLVESELAFRQAAHRKAEILAIEASRGLKDHHLLVRANVRAGQSAHFEGRDQEAIAHHRRAQSAARTNADKREALWGEFVCSLELETKDSSAVLGRLEALGSDDASDEIRRANGSMLLAMRAGSGIDSEWLSAIHRLPRVEDPLIRSSFLHVWSSLLAYTGRYAEALDAAEQQLHEAEQNRLAFVRPHALIRRAFALRGLKRYREALKCLTEAERGRDSQGDHLTLASASARVGILLALGDVPGAVATPEPRLEGPAAANAVAELVAVRALALACSERADEALDGARRSQSLSAAAEPQNLAKLASAVAAIVDQSPAASQTLSEAFAAVTRSGNIDAFVTAYRGYPQLLHVLATTDKTRAEVGSILSLADDRRLGRGILPPQSKGSSGRSDLLSPREREVLALVSQGLRNRDIAQRLFISEVTVKVHVRNIMKKLGARSRAHAVSLGAELD
jgi:ATP/maltotriose-dependent transcriptional regulator MalT